MTDLVAGKPATADLVEFEAAYDFTEAWLANRRFSGNTREAYRRDIHQWLRWCAEQGLDPLQVTFLHVNAWARLLEEPPEGEDGRRRKPMAPTTVARKLSAVSSWYSFIVKLGKLMANPAAAADRPMVDRDFSPTVSFTRAEATRMLEAAAESDLYLGEAAPVLAAWMVEMGTRATETTLIDLSDLGYDQGHRTVRLTLKGGKPQSRPIPPPLGELLDDYLQRRAGRLRIDVNDLTGALFVDRRGDALSRHALARFVRRLAKMAGLPNGDRITPHSFRHAFCAIAEEQGVSLERRQRAMGHRDSRTTQRYGQHLRALTDDPALVVAIAVARRMSEDLG
jgi:integrase/recombinase XerD